MENRLRRRNALVQTLLDNWFYILVLVFLWRFPYLVADWTDSVADPPRRAFGTSSIWQQYMIEVFILCILAMSYNLMLGFTGLISFGHGVFFGVGAYSVAILVTKFDISFARSVGVALAIGIIISLIWSVASFRIKGVYFAMFTLAFAEIFFQSSRLTMFSHLTGGDDGLTWSTPDWLNPVRNRLQLYNIALGCFVIAFLLVRRLMNSPSGRVLMAIRDNPDRTQTLGYNIHLYKTLSIVVAGLLATFAGVMQVVLFPQAEPSLLGVGRTLDPLLMTLIGGLGTIAGPAIGVSALHIGEKLLRVPDLQISLDFIVFKFLDNANTVEYWPLALGATFVIFVLVIPYGIVGSVNKLWLEIRRWFRKHLFNPLVRRYPKLATWAASITGEPPEIALAIAQQPQETDFAGWLKLYPVSAINSIIFVVAVVAGLITWDWQLGVSWFLFLALLTLPLRILFLVLRNPSMLYLIAILVAIVLMVWIVDDVTLTDGIMRISFAEVTWGHRILTAGLISLGLMLAFIPIHRILHDIRQQPALRSWIPEN